MIEVPFDCRCGSAFFKSNHLWVVITEPFDSPPKVIIVNLTTKRLGSDETVILDIGEHNFIKHLTVISYSDAVMYPIDHIVNCVNGGSFKQSDSFSLEVLTKIQQGLLDSPHTPKKLKTIYKQLINGTLS